MEHAWQHIEKTAFATMQAPAVKLPTQWSVSISMENENLPAFSKNKRYLGKIE